MVLLKKAPFIAVPLLCKEDDTNLFEDKPSLQAGAFTNKLDDVQILNTFFPGNSMRRELSRLTLVVLLGKIRTGTSGAAGR